MIIHILLLLSATKNPIDLHLMSQKYRPEYDVDLGAGRILTWANEQKPS